MYNSNIFFALDFVLNMYGRLSVERWLQAFLNRSLRFIDIPDFIYYVRYIARKKEVKLRDKND